MKGRIITRTYESPCGTLILGAYESKLCLCDWQAGNRGRVADRLRRLLNAELEEGATDVLDWTAAQLDEYFDGRRRVFDVPLLFVGTDFQKKVWESLLAIPYGQTISYGELSQRIGMPTAVRAVASANGANAISIFAPCHRVIGSNDSLTGYAGGLPAKEFLLNLEGALT